MRKSFHFFFINDVVSFVFILYIHILSKCPEYRGTFIAIGKKFIFFSIVLNFFWVRFIPPGVENYNEPFRVSSVFSVLITLFSVLCPHQNAYVRESYGFILPNFVYSFFFLMAGRSCRNRFFIFFSIFILVSYFAKVAFVGV